MQTSPIEQKPHKNSNPTTPRIIKKKKKEIKTKGTRNTQLADFDPVRGEKKTPRTPSSIKKKKKNQKGNPEDYGQEGS